MNVTILGTGYVGLTTGACLAYLGHQVTCVDPDAKKIDALERGEMPFFEPHLAELVADARENLTFTTDYAQAIPEAQVIFIAVGTPPGANGAPDLRYLEVGRARHRRGSGRHFTVVVNKSTVPIGSGNWVDSLVRDAFQKRTGTQARRALLRWRRIPNFCAKVRPCTTACIPIAWWWAADEPQTAEVLYTLYRPILEQSFQRALLPAAAGSGSRPCR